MAALRNIGTAGREFHTFPGGWTEEVALAVESAMSAATTALHKIRRGRWKSSAERANWRLIVRCVVTFFEVMLEGLYADRLRAVASVGWPILESLVHE